MCRLTPDLDLSSGVCEGVHKCTLTCIMYVIYVTYLLAHSHISSDRRYIRYTYINIHEYIEGSKVQSVQSQKPKGSISHLFSSLAFSVTEALKNTHIDTFVWYIT